MIVAICLSIFAMVSLSVQQQKDPLKDFCRLFGHQTTLVDRHMYIDGGLVNWAPLSTSSTNYTSRWLRTGDLDDDNGGFPQQHILDKQPSVPSVHGGILWADEANKQVYLYGGEYGDGQPEDFKLWFYDIVYNTWNVSNVTSTSQNIRRASWGGGVAVQDRGQGYYYGGWLTNASVPGYNTETALSNMLVYDMLSNTFRNQSGPDGVGRAEGSMTYLPVGDAGMLVYFGGIQQPFDNGTVTALPMTDIYLYDIANDKWYTETAAGDVPQNRRRFCAGATWTDDRTSYNIYLFGGAAVGDGEGYGDVYVLSLPSFTWIKFWPRPEDNVGKTFPHHSLSCNVIGGSQMIIMGGHFTNFTAECDVPTIYGQHGLDLGKANDDQAKWAMFNPNLTTYRVPQEIAQTIGGGPTGGATVLAPTSGWGQRDLSVQFTRAYTQGQRDPTRPIPTATSAAPSPSSSASKDDNKKAIIGGVIGGVGGLLLITAAVIFILWRRKKSKAVKSPRPPSELPPSSMYGPKSPVLTQGGSYHTPQGSPPPPSHIGWSEVGNHPRSPDYTDQTPFAQPQPRYHQSALHQSPITPGWDAPKRHIATPQELPSVRSPAPPRRSMLKPVIDPYFANHPPSPPS